MILTEEQKIRQRRGNLAKDFLSSDFFQTFLLAYMDKERMNGYPNPKEEGWEDKYRLAFAKDEVYTTLITTLQSWTTEADKMTELEGKDEQDITTA